MWSLWLNKSEEIWYSIIELKKTQNKMSLNVSHGSDMASSDVEDDNLNENLMEFERNILIDEEINIRKSQA